MRGSQDCINIGLLGCGTIGSGVYHLIQKNYSELTEAAGKPLKVKRILVKDPYEPRPFEVDREIMVTDPGQVISDESIDIFVEVMGGIQPALSLALDIISSGRHLVTANKEIIANHGRELMAKAAQTGSHVRFEAAVGGGIPLIRPLEESLGGDNILKVMGIVNGTTNYILSKMSSEGSAYDQALAEAQRLGFAESDPTADVEGFDAASKLAILCSILFKRGVTPREIYREGILSVRPEDLENARELGFVVKLLAIAVRENDLISARVHPTMIPDSHPLASVNGNFNAIFVVGESVGELMFYGQGAGSLPTATAVLGDVVNVARNLGRPPISTRTYWLRDASIKPIGDTVTRFYMVLRVIDKPGVLARIAGVFGDNNVSLESVVQKGIGDSAQIILITHEVIESNFMKAKNGLEKLDVVLEIPSVIRVESGSESKSQNA